MVNHIDVNPRQLVNKQGNPVKPWKCVLQKNVKTSWAAIMNNQNVLKKSQDTKRTDHKYQKQTVIIFWSRYEKRESATCGDWKDLRKEEQRKTVEEDF